MVPDLTIEERNFLSSLDTICNIFEQLLECSSDKQVSILKQEWDCLFFITNRQNELLSNLESTKRRMDHYVEPQGLPELDILKKRVRESMLAYQEREGDNIKMLNDTLFVAKQKVEKVYQKKTKRTTYSRKLEKDSGLWSESSILQSHLV